MGAPAQVAEPVSAMTAWERWSAGFPPRDAEERARYAEYAQCTAPELEAGV